MAPAHQGCDYRSAGSGARSPEPSPATVKKEAPMGHEIGKVR